MRTKLLIACLVLLAATASAQDPLAAGTWGRGWAGVETVYSPDTSSSTLGVGWVEGQVGFGRFAVAGTAGVLGATGQLNLSEPSTFNVARGRLAGHYNLVGRSGASCGVAAGVEYSVPLQTKFTVYHTATAGAGLVCSGAAWRTYVLFGQDAQLPGMGVLTFTHFPISSRVSWVTRASFGENQAFVASLDVVARIF